MPSKYLQTLKARHFKIIELELDGRTGVQIAAELGMPAEEIKNIVNSPLYQHELSRRRDKGAMRQAEEVSIRRISASEILSDASGRAAEVQVGLLGSRTEKIQQTAAMDILDRSGHPKISKSESRNVNASFMITEGLLDRLQLASRDAFGKELDTSGLESAQVAQDRPSDR